VDKLRSIEVFTTAVDAGSFSAAARRLDISAVMVGKLVRQLETHLGARLLERSTRRQGLTDAGRRFYEEGKRVLEQLRWAESSVERLAASPSGLLRISAATTLGECVIAAAVADYQARFPQVRVELELSNGVVDLIEDGIDLAIRIGALDPALDLVARPLGHYRMVICAAPAYLARHGVPATPADLAAHRCLGHAAWNPRTAWRLDPAGAAAGWPARTVLRCNSGAALRQAALHGAGLLLQPQVLVAEDLAAGRLVGVLDAYLPTGRPVHALYRQDRQPLPKLASFVAFLQQQVAPRLA